MFSWFRHKSSRKGAGPQPATPAAAPQPSASPEPADAPPPLSPNGNPGFAVRGDIGFSNAKRQWTEHFDMVTLTAEVLKQHGHNVQANENALLHVESGCVIKPQLAGFQPLDAGGISTVTTVEVDLPSLNATGIFEYQHSTGDNTEDSIRKGLDQWAQVDLVPLLDALLDQPAHCTMLNMALPAKDGQPARTRRAVLGPVVHFRQTPASAPADAEEHPFCPCCLLTNTFVAFKSYLDGDGTVAIRLFAMRDENGKAAVDCRVNGIDYEPGMVALRKYVGTWPQSGVEFRKQYVVVHTFAGALAQEATPA